MANAIQVNGLSYRYPDGTPALEDITFTVEEGQRVALVGPNGGGKSTLLLHLNGILRSTTGRIQVEDLTLDDKTVGQIRARTGLVFQNPDDQLFSPRVHQDVAFGPLQAGLSDDEVRMRVDDALKAVGMSDYANRISHHLSVGEKKRIALATVLSMAPRILILDEPSAGLDPRGRRQLMQLLGTFTQQTMLISTHDMRLARMLCTDALVIEKGRIVASGECAAILNNRSLMEQHGLETPDAI